MGAEAWVEALAYARGRGESVGEMAHDARNMLTALGLYCDLLEEPGVLTAPYLHYGNELRLVAAAARRLVEKLVVLDADRLQASPGRTRNRAESETGNKTRNQTRNDTRISKNAAQPAWNRTRNWDLMPAVLIDDLALELRANRDLLAALAGPSVSVTVNIQGGALPVGLTGEDLTRVLVNLVKNSAEAMPAGGRVAFGLHEFHSGAEQSPWLVLTLEDNGPGIPKGALDAVFAAGYTTRDEGALGNSAGGNPTRGRVAASAANRGWVGAHRGLGLSITRSIVEAAGGCMHAVRPAATGARFEIELPVRQR
jgi:signal transduction histidine kinase